MFKCDPCISKESLKASINEEINVTYGQLNRAKILAMESIENLERK